MNKKDFFWKLAYLAIAGGVFLIDQTTKAWAVACLRFDGDRSLIAGFLNLAYAQNTGRRVLDARRAWRRGTLGLVGRRDCRGHAWCSIFSGGRREPMTAFWARSLCCSRASPGNVTDRLRLGYVIDFIDVQFGSWHYPTFNVADTAICVGAGLLILDMFLSKNERQKPTGRECAQMNDST